MLLLPRWMPRLLMALLFSTLSGLQRRQEKCKPTTGDRYLRLPKSGRIVSDTAASTGQTGHAPHSRFGRAVRAWLAGRGRVRYASVPEGPKFARAWRDKKL